MPVLLQELADGGCGLVLARVTHQIQRLILAERSFPIWGASALHYSRDSRNTCQSRKLRKRMQVFGNGRNGILDAAPHVTGGLSTLFHNFSLA